MPRRKRNGGNGSQVVGPLMSDEFRVEVKKGGWEKVAMYLRDVGFSEFLAGGELQLTFCESKDLDVLTFFTDWIVKKEAYDVVIWLGSGKKGLLFSGCSVDGMYMSDMSMYDKEECGLKREVMLVVDLKYVAVFVIGKTKAEKCAIG
jgi:hypothetical protein